jgi:hypothetical protein
MRSCRAIVPPNTDACGKMATHVVTFSDGQRAAMCTKCMVAMRELASSQTPPAPFGVERLSLVARAQ